MTINETMLNSRRRWVLFAPVLALLFSSVSFHAYAVEYAIETVVTDVDVPWGMTWLPSGDMLITERKGKLFRFDTERQRLIEIAGVPEVHAKGQGGLLDIELHPNYVESGWLYLTYSSFDADSNKSSTALLRGKLREDQLVEQSVLYQGQQEYELLTEIKRPVKKLLGKKTRDPKVHYGGRIEFDDAGFLYFSIGDRGNRDVFPQDPSRDGGKIYRLTDDGSIPAANPFANTDTGKPAVYSLGHRNPQGMAKNPATGKIWIHEHGPKGGDEINIIEAGANYGWPILSFGVNYSGSSFAEGTEREGYRSPAWQWTPSIAPSGMTFVTSDRYPDWRGDLLVGSLKFNYLVLCRVEGDEVITQEILFADIGRVRNVRQAPDGYIYVAVEDVGIVRLVPSTAS